MLGSDDPDDGNDGTEDDNVADECKPKAEVMGGVLVGAVRTGGVAMGVPNKGSCLTRTRRLASRSFM